MFIVGKLRYKRQYWDWDINTGATLAKVLIEFVRVWVWKLAFQPNKHYEMHAFVVAVSFKLKLSGCWWNTRGGEFRKENQLSTERIMALHFQMLSFFMVNNNLNVCQKLEKNNLRILVFCWILLLLSLLPVPSQNVCEKLKASETRVLWAPSFLARRRYEFLKPPAGICQLFKTSCGAGAHRSRGPWFKLSGFVKRVVTTFAHTQIGSFLNHSVQKSLTPIHMRQAVSLISNDIGLFDFQMRKLSIMNRWRDNQNIFVQVFGNWFWKLKLLSRSASSHNIFIIKKQQQQHLLICFLNLLPLEACELVLTHLNNN